MKSTFIKLIFGVLFWILVFYLYIRLTDYEQTVAFFGLALLFAVKSLIPNRVENNLEELKESMNNLNEVTNKLLILLEKYDPEFVKEQREERAVNNVEGED